MIFKPIVKETLPCKIASKNTCVILSTRKATFRSFLNQKSAEELFKYILYSHRTECDQSAAN